MAGRGQTSLGYRRGDVGGVASSRSEAEAEWEGEGRSLGFPSGGSVPGRWHRAEWRVRPGKERGRFGLGFR
jgi:hypothetical protein